MASTSATGSQALTSDTWYRLELHIAIADTGGSLELHLFSADSTLPLETLTLANQDTLNSNLQRFRIGMPNSTGMNATWDFFFDDIAWNDDEGTFQKLLGRALAKLP